MAGHKPRNRVAHEGGSRHGDTGQDAATPGEDLYTIDELAELSGVPARTIRFYQSKGTLTAPERRGRAAYYRADHLERLELIAELQDRGLRLDAIRDALEKIKTGGASLQEWLGMGDTLQQPWSDERPIVLTEKELLAKLANLRVGMLAELERLGLVQRQSDSRPATYVVPSPGLLDVGVELGQAGIDAITTAEAEAIMRKRLGRLADELVTFFADRAGEGFGMRDDPGEIARAYAAVRPHGMRAIHLIFAQEMERALRHFVEQGGAISRSLTRPDGARGRRQPQRRASADGRAGKKGASRRR